MKKRILSIALVIAMLSSVLTGIVTVNAATNAKLASVVPSAFSTEQKVDAESGYEVPLNGAWDVYKWTDTAIDTDPYAFVSQELYSALKAEMGNQTPTSVNVPCNLAAVSGFETVNSVMYSTEVALEDIGNSSFYIDFDGTNWLTSVFVNDQLAAQKKGTRMAWQCDITPYLNANTATQKIEIFVKGPRYAIDPVGTVAMDSINLDIGKNWKYESEKLSDYMEITEYTYVRWLATIMPTTKGDADGSWFGITDELSIVSTGEVKAPYVQDVYVTTNVVNDEFKITDTSKTLNAEITLYNPTDSEMSVSVQPTVQSVALKKVDGKFTSAKEYGANESIAGLTSQDVSVPAKSTKVVKYENIQWKDAELWWPDINPDTAQMYNMKVTVTSGGSTSDIFDRQFGFRDIKIDGIHIRVNGVIRKFWNNLGSLRGKTTEDMLESFLSENARFERFGADLGLAWLLSGFYGYVPSVEEQLDWLDFMGIPVRVCSMIDGMDADYYMYDRATKTCNTVMFENFQNQIEDMTRNHRNHPSNVVWSVENELMFINAALVFADGVPLIEENCMKYITQPLKVLDSSRPSMYDGGGAGTEDQWEIYCHHYIEETDTVKNSESLVGRYGQSGGWDWENNRHSDPFWQYKGDRPYAAGEVAYFSGNAVMSEYGEYMKKLYNKYRWNDVAITCPWTAGRYVTNCLPAMEELAIIPEIYFDRFTAKDGLSFDVKIFNDTFSSGEVEAKWSLINSRTEEVYKSGSFGKLSIEPGTGVVRNLTIEGFELPENTDCYLRLEASQEDSKGFRKAEDFREDIEVLAWVADTDPVVDGTDVSKNTIGVFGTRTTDGQNILDSLGRTYKNFDTFKAAYDDITINTLMVEANEDNLTKLNEAKAMVDSYVENGGWIMLFNLTDDAKALEQYNQLLGTNHIVRPFRAELSMLNTDDFSLTGLETTSLMKYTDRMIASWKGFSYPSNMTYSYCVDATDEMMPFFDYESVGGGNSWAYQFDSRWNKANICNGFFSYDFWAMTSCVAWVNNESDVTAGISLASSYGNRNLFKLKNTENLDKLTVWNTEGGNTVFKDTDVMINGEVYKQVELPMSEAGYTIDLDSVEADSFDLVFRSLNHFEEGFKGAILQQISLTRKTPDWIYTAKVKALNNSGSLVRYSRGTGGFLLNNICLDNNVPIDADGNKLNEAADNLNSKVTSYLKILNNLVNVSEQVKPTTARPAVGGDTTPEPTVTPSVTAEVTPEVTPTPSTTPTAEPTPKVTIKFAKKKATMKVGNKLKLKVTLQGAKKATFKTSKKKVVKIVKKSKKWVRVKALKKGKATITAKAGGKSAKCKITVKKKKKK